MFLLQDKTAIVTGSTYGIGYGILKVLAKAGAHVVMNGSKKPVNVDTLLEEASSFNNRAIFVQADVTKSDGRQRLLDETLNAFGGLDILVNNAGSFYDEGWGKIAQETFDRTMDLNVKSMLFMSKLAIDYFRYAKRKGSIVLVASVNSFQAERNSICYDISKGALLMMTKALAVETFKDDINVNALCPGLVDTPLVRKLLGDNESFRKLSASIPKGRFCTIEECGYATLYMVSEEGHYMTGQHIILDGGILAVQSTIVSDLRS